MQGLVGCSHHVPYGFFVRHELHGLPVEIGYDRSSLLGDVNSREHVDKRLLAGEIAVYLPLGDVNKTVRPAVGVEKLEWFQQVAVFVDKGKEELRGFHCV